jgi:hypothetical protein
MGSAVWCSTILKMGRLEDDALAVAFAVSFRFDAVLAHGTFLAALDAAFATSQTSRLGSFAREFGFQGGLSLAGISAIKLVFVVALVVRRLVPGGGIHLAKDAVVVAKWLGWMVWLCVEMASA